MSVNQYKEDSNVSDLKESNTKNNRIKWILIFGMLFAILAGGSFTAGYLSGSEFPIAETQDQRIMKSEGGSITTSGVKLLPDERLPTRPPQATGQFNHRKDNLLYIHQFPTFGMVMLDKMDEYPLVEILITKDTLIFKDVTDFSSANGSGAIHQVVAPGSMEELTKGRSIIVWGEQRGERIIAKVLQYF